MSESFGTYELIEQIGTGGMAEVYLAKSRGAEGLEKKLVIKRILPKYSRRERFIEMFVDEATIAVNLNHPNIVQIYDFGKAEGDYYLAMEYVDGPNLAELVDAGMQAGRPMPLGEAVYVAIEVAKGLHYAHRREDEHGEPLKIVHRDISPQNILISEEGAVKIVDFGIAKAASAAEAEELESDRSVVKGKHRYMSPEQAGGGDVDHRSDIFSLGVVLFELVCREPLFDRDTVEETLSMVKSAVVPDISELNPEVPDKLESVLYRSLSQRREDRFQSAREMKSALTDVLYEFDDVHDAMTLSDHVRNVGDVDPSSVQEVSTDMQTRETDVTQSTSETTADGPQPVEMNTETELHAAQTVTEPAETAFVTPTRQRKEVVVLVGKLSGVMKLKSSIDEQHVWVQVLEEYTRIVDSIAFKNNGIVHHVDEFGFLVVLGLPISSQNDSLRGVRVARDLQEAISGMNLSLEMPIELSVGVAIGDVVVDQSEEGGFDWSFYGDDYEKAEEVAREAMPGEVLVSSQVYRRVEREFEFEEVGLDESTDTGDSGYKLAGPRPRDERIEAVRRSYRSFYGRDIPLKMLRDRYRQARLEKKLGGVLLLGEPGVGKSTVIEEFLSGLDHREVRVVRGMISPFDRDVPMGPLANLFGELMRLDNEQDLREQQSTLRTRIDALFPDMESGELELLEESLAYLFDIPGSGRSFSDLTAEERQRRTFLSLRRVLRRFARRKPIVFAVDDVHHLDSVSLEFFERLFGDAPDFPALWVMAAEQRGWHAGEEARDRLAGLETVSVERIGELNEEDAIALIEDVLRGQGVRELGAAEDIYELSGGNPLFIKEVVGILRDRGILTDPAKWRDIENTDARPSWLPTSVEGFISARIDRLEPGMKEALQRLALLWSPFSMSEAELVLEDEPADNVADLVRGEFLERADANSDQRDADVADDDEALETEAFRFCDELTQEVARRTLVPEKRRELHGELVAYLQGKDREQASLEDKVRLARHLDGAGRKEDAIDYYLEAAEEALEQQGASESVRLTDEVLDEVELSSEAAVRALDIRRQAWTMLGETQRATEAIDNMLNASDAEEPPVALPKKVRMLLLQSRFQRQQEDYERAESLAEEARQLAEESGDELSLAPVRYHEASRLMREGQLDDALARIDEAIEMHRASESSERREQLANCLNMKGVVYRRLGQHHRALEHYDDALEISRAIQSSKLKRHLLNNSGLALAYLGRYMEALARYREALEESRRLGHRRFQSEYLINIGHARYLLGDLEEAASMIRRGIYRAREAEIPADIANGMVSLGLVYREQGDLKAAEETLHEGLRRSDSIPDAFMSVYATFALAEVHLDKGTNRAANTAKVQAEDGLERARQSGMLWGEPVGKMLLARAASMRGHHRRAIDLAEESVEALKSVDVHDKPKILYHYVQILPDEDEYRDRRREAIREAKRLIENRRDRIDDDNLRQSYLQREIPNAVLNVAKLVATPDGDG